MAANDGPVPVRTLAHAARLMREARQLGHYGISAGEPMLDYRRLLARVREVTGDVRAHALLRDELQQAGVTLYEHAGTARFVEPQVIESEDGTATASRERHRVHRRRVAQAPTARLRADLARTATPGA